MATLCKIQIKSNPFSSSIPELDFSTFRLSLLGRNIINCLIRPVHVAWCMDAWISPQIPDGQASPAAEANVAKEACG